MRVQGFQGREAFVYFTHIHIIRPHTHYPPPHTLPAPPRRTFGPVPCLFHAPLSLTALCTET